MKCRHPLLLFFVYTFTSLAGCHDAGSAALPDRSVRTGAASLASADAGDGLADFDAPPPTQWRWESAPDFDPQIAVFPSVFWMLEDTESLRALIRQSRIAEGKTVLEIGTGSGLISLCCLKAGARRVVATDINPAAVANARYNALLLGMTDRLDVRRVPLDRPGAYSVIGESERFDLIISNPPWELSERPPQKIDDYAFYDPQFELMRSMLNGHRDHLKPGGKLLLVYGCVSAIKTLQDMAQQEGLTTTLRDDRDLDGLPELFLPGMLVEVRPLEVKP